MALADAADRVTPATAERASCCIGRIQHALDTEDRTLLESWLEPGSGKTNPWIASVLTADGHRNTPGRGVGQKSVQTHRSRGCGCFQ